MKLALIFSSLIFAFGVQAQSETEKVFKNEFGIDATSFILLFLKFNAAETPYFQNYYLTYRRKFQSGNIRFALGGAIEDTEVTSPFTEDQNDYHSNSSTLNIRVGWEFKNEISKKWQVFYGLDFRPSFNHSKDDALFWNGGYANGRDNKMSNYGIAPLLGFRFRINERLSLSTETSFSINFQKQKLNYYYTPITSSYPAIPDENKPATNSIYSSFAQPLMVFITFDI